MGDDGKKVAWVEQLAVDDTTYLIERIDEMIRDYKWMKKQVEHLQGILYGSIVSMKNWGVAMYGVEATMPRGSKGKSQAELKEMSIREERLYKRLKELEGKVYALELAGNLLSSEKEKALYDYLLDGMTYRMISYQIGINKDQVKNAKRKIFSQIIQNRQILSILKLENKKY